MAKILLLGDIMGRPGRHALADIIPQWQEHLNWNPLEDVLVGNVENLTHGMGVTPQTLAEIDSLGFDCFTSGNHAFDTGPQAEESFRLYHKLIRPLNYVGDFPGFGVYRFAKGSQQYLVINVSGQVFMSGKNKFEISNPFFALDQIITEQAQKNDIILVDIHAEATGEKQALGWYLDGRVSVVYGTHTHISTADCRILPQGTAYITDLGMTGAYNSVLGVKVETALLPFLEQGKFRMDFPTDGPAIVNALLVNISDNKVVSVERMSQITTLSN